MRCGSRSGQVLPSVPDSDPDRLFTSCFEVAGFGLGGEEIGRGQTSERAPLLSDLEYLLLTGKMIEAIRTAYRLAQREISRQDDVLPSQGDEQGALRGPWPDTGNGRQCPR